MLTGFFCIYYKMPDACIVGMVLPRQLVFNEGIMNTLGLGIGNKLLSIRSSNIAFCMGLKGEIIERAENHKGNIEVF